MELSYIFSWENFSYSSGNGNSQKNFVYFLKRKPLLCFGKWKPWKKSLLIKKRNFLIFWEKYIQNPYLELDAYSEPRYNQNLRHIQNTIKHIWWKVLLKFCRSCIYVITFVKFKIYSTLSSKLLWISVKCLGNFCVKQNYNAEM